MTIYFLFSSFLCSGPYCSPTQESLASLCQEIPGDAELHSLFRRGPNVASIKCPFEGPFTFSYDRGGGNCSDPVSRVDMCTWPNRLLFRFQACHSVRSESSGAEKKIKEKYCKSVSRRRDHNNDVFFHGLKCTKTVNFFCDISLRLSALNKI